GTNRASLDDRARRVRLLDLPHGDLPEDILGAAEDLPRLRVAELAPLAVGDQLHAGDEPVALPDRQRDRRALDLEHLAIDPREERQDLVHENAQRGSLGRRADGGGEDEQREDRGACKKATLYHRRCQLLTP